MFRKNSPNEQLSLFKMEAELNNYQKRRIERTWVSYFHENIFPKIDEEKYSILYSGNKASCPNMPVNIQISLLIIKMLLNMTDEEVIDGLMFDKRIQYAVHEENASKHQGSENILGMFRRRISEYERLSGINLFEETIMDLNEEIVKMSGIKRSLKRIDSMMISASCKRLNRIELVYEVNRVFVRKMKEQAKKVNNYEKYLNNEEKAEVLYKTRSTEENNKLNNLLKDSIKIYKRFKHDPSVNKLEEFETLKRLIEEQYDAEKGEARENHEIKASYMQTPYDVEATYRYKYDHNIGYTANIVEAVDEEKNLIVDFEIDKNIISDIEYMKRHIAKKEDDALETAVVDGAYYSNEVEDLAKEKNITIHPTELTGYSDPDYEIVSKFDVEKDKIINCPMGNRPTEQHIIGSWNAISATFDKKTCEKCPLASQCPIQFYKTKAKVVIKSSRIKRAKLMAQRNEANYKKISNKRAGIEGTASVLRRRYQIDKRPGKGLSWLKIAFSSSILSINIKKMVKMREKDNKKVKDIESKCTNMKKCIFLCGKYWKT